MPPPGPRVGSGKFETPWLRMQVVYATPWAACPPDEDPDAEPGSLEPPQPAARTPTPSSAMIATIHLIGGDRCLLGLPGRCSAWSSWLDAFVISWLQCVYGSSRSLYAIAPDIGLTEAVIPVQGAFRYPQLRTDHRSIAPRCGQHVSDGDANMKRFPARTQDPPFRRLGLRSHSSAGPVLPPTCGDFTPGRPAASASGPRRHNTAQPTYGSRL
jgi:hypothetical protein